MKKIKQLIFACITRCTDAIAVLYGKLHRKQPVADTTAEAGMQEPEPLEAIFLREWTVALTENARTFNGLYNGLSRVQSGIAKKPEKILREWYQRTHYKFENQPVDVLCQEKIQPLIEATDRDGLHKWANLLLEAAVAAGITREEAQTLVLTETNADAYVEWDGNDLYPEDEIKVVTPAWYQNGKLLEQGQCKKRNEEEE